MTIEPNPIMPYLHDHMHSHAKAFINAYGYFMTNLDGILKSRDITLPIKVHLVKVMVFPVVRYGCESWTIKKAEHRRIDALNCGAGEDSSESLGLQGGPTSPS